MAAIARGIVGVVLLGVFCLWLDLFVWYWTVAFAFVNVWFTFNWWRNEVMGHKWYYLGIDSDPEEDSIIDKLLKHMLPEEVSMTFLAFASVITLLLFVLYGHMTWEEVLRYREFGT